MKKYIGPYEILSEDIGSESTTVTFKDYTTEEGKVFTPPVKKYTNKTLSLIITKEPKDFEHVFHARYNPLIEDIIKTMASYDVHIGFRSNVQNDFDYVLTMVSNKITKYRDRLEDRLWGAEEHEKTLCQLIDKLAQTTDIDMIELKPRPKDAE